MTSALESETIAAIATAPGRAALSVVRLSGPDAFAVASKMVRGNLPPPGSFAHRRLLDSSGRIIDDAIVLVFASPRSYTGEDSVEFHCHGGSVTPSRVLSECISNGARLAGKGEFTYRAVMAGKLDLDEAQSVLDLINAKTTRAADDALAGIDGEARKTANRLYKLATEISAQIEHSLDIDEDELPESFFSSLNDSILGFKTVLEDALDRERRKKIMRDGALVVLSGPPNSGKSSLMNALLGEDRAIVSAEAGTTRDAIEAWLDVDGVPVRLVDTAGIRDAESSIEEEGVRRAEKLAARADIVIALDSGEARFGDDESRIIRVHSKCDLERGEGLNVSSVTGEGLNDLLAEITRRISVIDRSDDSRFSCVYSGALAELALDGESADLVIRANTMRRIATSLAALIGAEYTRDMLDNLFSRFCVGK